MSYTAMYRKFRPNRFEDVKGQDHIITTLKNQIKSDRIGHAYLFCGTRGTGKTSVAKLFAKAINCEHPNGEDPCLECESCRAIAAGTSMNVIEIDAASNNGVDNIRQIVEEVQYPPTQGRYKVYIIDEVHMLSIGAFNALLKTLEEPPAYVIFILATTEVHKIPITILSRCQRYDFKRIGVDEIVGRINELMAIEGLEADEAAIRYVARTADGSMRDALSLLDQCVAFHFGKKLTYEMALDVLGAVDMSVFSTLLRTILVKDVAGVIVLLEKIIQEGRELTQFVVDFTWYLRNLLLVQTSDDITRVLDMSPENLKRLEEEAGLISEEDVIRFIRIFSELTNQIRYASNKRVLIEIALIKLIRPDSESRDDSILPRLRKVEEQLENGVPMMAAPTQGAPVTTPTVNVAPKPKQPLPASVPDDIKTIVASWPKVINAFDYPAKSYVKAAKPSLGANGELVLVFPDEMAKTFYTASQGCDKHVDELKEIVSNIAGKEVTVRIESAPTKEAFDNDAVDLRQFFGGSVPIEIEDE